MLWPRRGVGPAFRYLRTRLLRLKGSPHAIAAGFACGAAVSFLPLPGLHFLLGALAAFLSRGSIIASAAGTVIGNPWTFPFIWLGGYEVGRWLGIGSAAGMPHAKFGEAWIGVASAVWDGRFSEAAAESWRVLGPTLVGGGLIGLTVGVVLYFGLRKAIGAYQASRRAKLAAGRERWRRLAPMKPAETSEA